MPLQLDGDLVGAGDSVGDGLLLSVSSVPLSGAAADVSRYPHHRYIEPSAPCTKKLYILSDDKPSISDSVKICPVLFTVISFIVSKLYQSVILTTAGNALSEPKTVLKLS